MLALNLVSSLLQSRLELPQLPFGRLNLQLLALDHRLEPIIFFAKLNINVDDLVQLLPENFEAPVFLSGSHWGLTKLFNNGSELLLFSSDSGHLVLEFLNHRCVLLHVIAIAVVDLRALGSILLSFPEPVLDFLGVLS